MPLTGKDVWDSIVKAGFLSGPYDPKRNRYCANADVLAGLLNEVLSRRTPESRAAELHEWAKAHGQNQPSSNDGATNNSKSPPRAAAGGGKNRRQPDSSELYRRSIEPITKSSTVR